MFRTAASRDEEGDQEQVLSALDPLVGNRIAVETIAILFMLVGGVLLAGFALAVVGYAGRETERTGGGGGAWPRLDSIAASILFQVLTAGGIGSDEALRRIRRETGIGAPVTRGIDLTSWAESYARGASPHQRDELLETAVRLIAEPGSAVPLRQYAALLDLSFGLGFQTDALARLRAVYGFDYVDHAKAARPKGADRAAGSEPLFVREARTREQLLRVLGLDGEASRQDIIAAFRKLARLHHPDRYHGASPEEESEAAGRFIEIARAYEELLQMAPE